MGDSKNFTKREKGDPMLEERGRCDLDEEGTG